VPKVKVLVQPRSRSCLFVSGPKLRKRGSIQSRVHKAESMSNTSVCHGYGALVGCVLLPPVLITVINIKPHLIAMVHILLH